MTKKIFHVFILIGIIFSLLSIAPLQTVRAAGITWTVDSTADAPTGDDGICNVTPGDCTLRDAIALATDGDIINITATPLITVDSTLGPYYTENDLTINGPGKDLLTITGNDLTRVFYPFTTSTISISNMTITHGYSNTWAGAILNYGDLTLNNVTVSESYAQFGGGGIYNQPTVGSSLTMTNSAITGNSASNGAGIYSPSDSPLSLTNVEISANIAAQWGGGIYISSVGTTYASTINQVYIYSNIAGIGGGGVYLDANSNLTITNSALISNQAVEYGGAISTYANNLADASTINLKNVTISSNSLIHEPGGRQGAGIYLNGHAILNNVTVMDNHAGNGGAFTNPSYGGAFYSAAPVGSTLDIKNSIFANNLADNGPICAGNSFAASAIQYSLLEEENCYTTDGVNGVDVGPDPLTDPLTNAGYASVHPLTATSPSLNTGSNLSCETVDQRGVSRPQGVNCDMGAFESIVTLTVTLRSVNTNDGWILESTETSGNGGTLNSAATTFNLGDDLADKQYRAILHFDTSSLPDNAVITSATLKIKKQGGMGTDPFTILGDLKASTRKPAFGAATLALSDFKSAPGKNNVATFSNIPVSNWYSALLNNAGRVYLNRTGTTQFRLAFTTDDNNDNGNDFMKFYSGNAGTATRPQLIIQYYIP
jgi:hypothetical protein